MKTFVKKNRPLTCAFVLILSFLHSNTIYASVIEYSMAGYTYFYEFGTGGEIIGITEGVEITGIALIDDNKFPNYLVGDPDCPSGPGSWSCDTSFNFTHFEMYIGEEYEFTGDNGYITYTNSDTYGALFGSGDWSMMSHSNDSGYLAPIVNYEQWQNFELPDIINWESEGFSGEVTAINNLLENSTFIVEVTLEKVGPVAVPAPSVLILAMIGLIVVAVVNRKTCKLSRE